MEEPVEGEPGRAPSDRRVRRPGVDRGARVGSLGAAQESQTFVGSSPCSVGTKTAFCTAFEWYIQTSLKAVATLGDWRDGTNLGSYEYAKKLLNGISMDDLTFDYLIGNDAVMCGDPDHCQVVRRVRLQQRRPAGFIMPPAAAALPCRRRIDAATSSAALACSSTG